MCHDWVLALPPFKNEGWATFRETAWFAWNVKIKPFFKYFPTKSFSHNHATTSPT